MVTRRRAVALVAGLVLGAGAFASTYALTRASHHRAGTARVAAATPAPIISVAPTPAPTAAPVSHAGLRVKMPEIGIDLPLVDGDGYNAPLYKAAHYPGTTWPGEGGRSVIYAHARVGMFGPLFGARVGEHIEVTGPDGAVQRYVIAQYYPRWPVTDLRWLRGGDHEEIVLVTCTTYNYNDPRIIAVGEPQ